ncbi:MAG TPA: ABC transporter ATP-binding protein [Stellaceae bacterium]|nr:ABC transporter ATP-binding protein [Stellaceae bacterium]
MTSEIAVEHLTKRFGTTTAVLDVSFTVAPGEVFGLVGPDGAGKSTILRMLAGVMKPDRGTIALDGVDVVVDPDRVKEHVSYMPQRFGLYEDLTVDENIRFYSDLFGIDAATREARARPLLDASGMTAFRKRLAGQLSGGMKQKLGLTCSLIHAPRVLLLDEPTTGVDPVSRRDFWRILFDLREAGVTLVIATAYLDEAERCNRLALLHQGRLRYCDTPAALKRQMSGALIVVFSPAPRAVRDVIKELPGIRSAIMVGDGVHAVADGDQRIAELRRALTAAEVPFSGIEPAEPSVEDAFMALLKEPA